MTAPIEASRALATQVELPLLHKRVMITAPRQYARTLGSYVIDAGARPIWVPAIQIVGLPEHDELDSALTSLKDFSHLAFTSKNGIYAVMDRLTVLHGGFDQAVKFMQSTETKLCALGADANVLQRMGIEVAIQPKEPSTLGLVRELESRKEADGATVLCPIPRIGAPLTEPQVIPRFLVALETFGAEPHPVHAYMTNVGSLPNECAAEKRMLTSGDIDAIVFSSTAEAEGLIHVMGSSSVIGEAVEEHGVILAAHGPYTAKGAGALLEMDIPCVSKNFSTFRGVVTALEEMCIENPTPP